MIKQEKAVYDKDYREKKKEKIKKSKKDYYNLNKEVISKKSKIKYDANPDYYKEKTKNFEVSKEKKYSYNKKFKLKQKYNLTIEEYEGMQKQQDYKCKICNRSFTDKVVPYVDHCHKSGKIRGLLCITCNSGLGMANDDIKILSNMINYLKHGNCF